MNSPFFRKNTNLQPESVWNTLGILGPRLNFLLPLLADCLRLSLTNRKTKNF